MHQPIKQKVLPCRAPDDEEQDLFATPSTFLFLYDVTKKIFNYILRNISVFQHFLEHIFFFI